ncbi:MAG: zinc-dependent peptidase [Rubrivivax sp.]|nr:zinc-dependent peptidase [Rubrivivax sp.]
MPESLAPWIAAAFVPLMALMAAALWWGPGRWRRWRQARVVATPFPAEWRAILRRRMPLFARLPADVQLRAKKRAQVLLAEVPFVGCGGLVVTDEMRVLVATQAALLLLHARGDALAALREVWLYPDPFVVPTRVADGSGLVHEGVQARSGESWQRGTLVLAWSQVLVDAATPGTGHNVVIHEFAHQLDQAKGQAGGGANGAPWLPTARLRRRWAEVLGREFGLLRAGLAEGRDGGLLGAYAATDPAEFFAVASERFFDRPHDLATQYPALWEQLKSLYRCDPRWWVAATDTTPVAAA